MKPSTPPGWYDNPWARTFHVSTLTTTSPSPRPATAAASTALSPGSGTALGSALALGRIDVVGLELAVEVAALDAQALGGTGHVPVVGAQLGQDERALEVVARVLERAVVRLGRGRSRFLRPERRRQGLGRDHVARRHDDQALHHVAQLAHVAGPVVGQEVAERLVGERLGAFAVLGAELCDEVAHVGRDVVLARAQRRDLDRDHVEPI